MRQLLEKHKIKNKAERFSIDLQSVIQKYGQMMEWDREEEEEYSYHNGPGVMLSDLPI